MSSETNLGTAEQRFRQAFERLKTDKPALLERGTPVSQNNVAREAGCDPSALRKTRFPSLVREIQAYVEVHGEEHPSKRQKQLKVQKTRADLNDRLDQAKAQRSHAQSQLLSAQRRIVELTTELNIVKRLLEERRSPTSPLGKV